ncbi:Uncharacterised protein [Burkholderia pseudomallei]|nr:Uncharacterised protein [Burkholderia pseudomallei]CAJ3759461.1 Uncharacterised protein [Burkholderia pseudomallei]CAJ3830326.1 Uncharacterised protein [Burkholderia pseudomallei]CAJ4439471.1 Uncharacterised protein [Burkholderia pseudomallei]CAJ4468006.1 Uncharacterised protein [Burkholderia pseudomallei]
MQRGLQHVGAHRARHARRRPLRRAVGRAGFGARHANVPVHRAAAGPRARLRRRVEQLEQVVVQLEQRNRATRHVERGQEGARPCTRHLDAAPAQAVVRRAQHDAELHVGRRAEPVHEQRDPVAARDRLIVDDRRDERFGQRVGRHRRRALYALFAVYAQPELDFVIGQAKAGLLGARHRAAVERDAHRAEPRRRRVRGGGHLRQREAALGGRAGELVHEHGAGDAAAAPALGERAQRHVVRDDDDLDRNAVRARELGRETEIEAVARVVLHDEQRAVRARRRANRGEHRVGGRRREDFAAHGRAQHSRADIAAMRRLVAAAAAGDDRDRALGRLRQRAPDQHVFVAEHGDMRRLPRDAFQHFAHDVGRMVDELFHGGGFLAMSEGGAPSRHRAHAAERARSGRSWASPLPCRPAGRHAAMHCAIGTGSSRVRARAPRRSRHRMKRTATRGMRRAPSRHSARARDSPHA